MLGFACIHSIPGSRVVSLVHSIVAKLASVCDMTVGVNAACAAKTACKTLRHLTWSGLCRVQILFQRLILR